MSSYRRLPSFWPSPHTSFWDSWRWARDLTCWTARTRPIHDHVLAARERQLRLIRKTRRESVHQGPTTALVKTDGEGFVTRINVEALGKAAQSFPGGAEVTLLVGIGSYVAFEDDIVAIKAQTHADLSALSKIAQAAVVLEGQRDITADAAYGLGEIAMIGWTSISSAKSQVGPGLLAIHALRDIMAHGSVENKEEQGASPLPIVYTDSTFEQLLDAFEALAVVSSESMQYQAFAEVLRTFSRMYPRLGTEHHARVEDLLLRILSSLGDHVLTRDLDSALSGLEQTLEACNRLETASLVREAQEKLQRSVGKLNSRSTRVPG